MHGIRRSVMVVKGTITIPQISPPPVICMQRRGCISGILVKLLLACKLFESAGGWPRGMAYHDLAAFIETPKEDYMCVA